MSVDQNYQSAGPSKNRKRRHTPETDFSTASSDASILPNGKILVSQPSDSNTSREEQSLYDLSKEELVTLVVLRGKEIKKLHEETKQLHELNLHLQKYLPGLVQELANSIQALKNVRSSTAEDCEDDCIAIPLSVGSVRASNNVNSTTATANTNTQYMSACTMYTSNAPVQEYQNKNITYTGQKRREKLQELQLRDDHADELTYQRNGASSRGAADISREVIRSQCPSGLGSSLLPASDYMPQYGAVGDAGTASEAPAVVQVVAGDPLLPVSTDAASVGSGHPHGSPHSPLALPADCFAADSEEMIELAPGIQIPQQQLEYCNTAWTYTRLVRQLMICLFDRQILASSSVMGRKPTMIKDAEAKPALDSGRRNAIITYVQSRFAHVDATQIKQAMAQKCRELHDQHRNSLEREMTDRSTDVRVLPPYSGISLMAMKHENSNYQSDYEDVSVF